MFYELNGLLANLAALNLAIVGNGDGTITVTVMPKAKDGVDAALSQPLSLTGTPEELDGQFGQLIASYGEARLSLQQQLEATNAILEAAKKEAATKATKAIAKKPSVTASPAVTDLGLEDDGGDEPSPIQAQAASIDDDNLFG